MNRNKRELPILDQKLLDLIFDGVYGQEFEQPLDEPVKDLLAVLYTLQGYNYRYRQGVCFDLYPIFKETVGPMEQSEGTVLWLALGLAIKELYGMRNSTLKGLLAKVTVRK